MQHFVAVSQGESPRARAEATRLVARCRAALLALDRSLTVTEQKFDASSTLLTATTGSASSLRAGHENVVVRCGAEVWLDDGRAADDNDLSTWIAGGGAPAAAAVPAAPCGALAWLPHAEALCARTDHIGLQHLYAWQGDGVAAVASSCLTLGRAAGAALDLEAVGAYAIVGSYVGTDTPFRGVSKLKAGERIQLRHGRVERFPTAHAAGSAESSTFEVLVQEGCDAVVAVTHAALRARSAMAVELSGGLDSRLLLAAIPRSLRRGRVALTIGAPGDPDVVLAAQIAAACGMEHRVIRLDAIRGMTAATALDLMRTASARADHCANPVVRGVLDWVDQQADRMPRLTGQNGEFARGFYYGGQREHARATPELVRSLIDWRVTLNESVRASDFMPDFMASARAAARSRIAAVFGSHDRGWLDATDEFYISQRMQRGAGIGYSAAGHERAVYAPLFQRRFVDWARRVPATHKRGGKMVASLLDRLDPDLARFPFASGAYVHDLVATDLCARLRRFLRVAGKVTRKLRQRLADSKRVPKGVALLHQAALSGGRRVVDLVPRAVGLDIVPASVGVLPAAQLNPASMGFLLGLEWTLEYCADSVGGGGPGPP
jgi:asparagine synthase (glutamine-hydrolysing)